MAAPRRVGPSPLLDDFRAAVDDALERAFAADDPGVAGLRDVVEYSLLAPGKRVRPILVLAACEAEGAPVSPVVPVAAAFELIHAYSLVHDDLPCMDDDDLRRGRPTSHRVHGEAAAVLAGDALQARAFELVATAAEVPAAQLVRIIAVLARGAGWRGMVGGQYLDIDDQRTASDIAALRDVHDRKTGALLAAAVEAGALAAGADGERLATFGQFGRELGWLFQLVDDLLDAVGDAHRIGKTPGKDARSGKVTAMDVFGGSDALRAAADAQLERCLKLADRLPSQGGRLPGIARFVRERDH